jgi:hypothetical protein
VGQEGKPVRNQDVEVEREQHRRQARAFVPPEFEPLQWDELQGEEKQGQRKTPNATETTMALQTLRPPFSMPALCLHRHRSQTGSIYDRAP